MNFLQLCNKARRECGVAGSDMTTTVGQNGILKKIIDRTAEAWVDTQAQRPCWKFLRNQKQFALTIGKRSYSVVDDLSLASKDKWDKRLSYIYQVNGYDETKLTWQDYQLFRVTHRVYPNGRPTILTEDVGGFISFDLTPDFAYTVTLDYWMTPELLAADADTPAMPEQYHSAIVWKSCMMFAGNETASELYTYAQSMYSKVFSALVLDQGELPVRVDNFPIAMGGVDRHAGPFPRPRT